MPLTVRFHAQLPEKVQWEEISADPQYPDCNKYNEKMSGFERFKIICRIAVYTFASLGMYLIRLKCTKIGTVDLDNLRNRTIIHYVSHRFKSSQENKIDEITGKTITHISDKEIKRREELRQARLEQQKQTAKTEEAKTGKKAIELSGILKSCVQKAHSFRKVCDDLKSIIDDKRVCFLEYIHHKNQGLALALEKYLNLHDYEHNSFHLAKHLSSFLKDENLDELMQAALKEAENAPKQQKSVHQKNFETFLAASNNLPNTIDWLISLHEKKDKALYSYACDLLALGERFSPRFTSLYQKEGGRLFRDCLASIETALTVDSKLKSALENHFKEWREVARQLQKNQSEHPDVVFNLRSFLKKELLEAGFNEEIQLAITKDKIDYRFIKLYFSKYSINLLPKMQKILANTELQQKAKDACKKKVLEAKEIDSQLDVKISDKKTMDAFRAMRMYNQTSVERDCVLDIRAGGHVLKALYPEQVDSEYFFDFLKVLCSSEFFKKPQMQKPDRAFFVTFNRFFEKIPRFNQITLQIMSEQLN